MAEQRIIDRNRRVIETFEKTQGRMIDWVTYFKTFLKPSDKMDTLILRQQYS